MSPLFEFHKLNPDGIQKARAIATAFNQLLQQLELMCPAGREMSVAKTNLEQACFFAKKAMACVTANQEAE